MEDILNKPIPEKALGIWWIGQGGFVFKTSGGKILFVDPYLSNSAERESRNRSFLTTVRAKG